MSVRRHIEKTARPRSAAASPRTSPSAGRTRDRRSVTTRPERPAAGFVQRSARQMALTAAPADVCDPLAARDALAVAHADLVRRVAHRIGRRLPPHVDRSDLIGVGMIGLLEAAARYRPSTGVPFEAFARRRVHGAIMDSLRDLDWVPRSVRALERKASGVATILRQQLGREPSQDEIAGRLGVSQTGAAARGALLDSARGEPLQEGLGTLEQCPDPSESIESRVLRDELSAHVRREVQRLPHREQRILEGYYREDLTMGEIGAHIGVCESRVSQLRSAAILRLRGRLATALAHAPGAAPAPRPWPPVPTADRAERTAGSPKPIVLPLRVEIGACQAA